MSGNETPMTNLKQLLHDAAARIEANAADLYLSSTTSDGEFVDTEDRRAYERERDLAIRLHTTIEQLAEVDTQHDACVDLVHALLDPERFGYTANPEIRDAARRALGLRACETVRMA